MMCTPRRSAVSRLVISAGLSPCSTISVSSTVHRRHLARPVPLLCQHAHPVLLDRLHHLPDAVQHLDPLAVLQQQLGHATRARAGPHPPHLRTQRCALFAMRVHLQLARTRERPAAPAARSPQRTAHPPARSTTTQLAACRPPAHPAGSLPPEGRRSAHRACNSSALLWHVMVPRRARRRSQRQQRPEHTRGRLKTGYTPGRRQHRGHALCELGRGHEDRR